MSAQTSPTLLPLALAAGLLAGCASGPETAAPATPPLPFFTVTPRLESAPSASAIPADADDPAFWFNAADPTKSLVVATQKEGGYSVYDVEGRTLLDATPDVRYNNVDIVFGFPLGGEAADLAVFSDRFSDNLSFYRLQGEAPYLVKLETRAPGPLFSGVRGGDSAYGLTVHRAADGSFDAFVSQNDRFTVRQVRLFDGRAGAVAWRPVRTFTLSAGAPTAHAEGMVVDPVRRRLFLAQEDVGLYVVELDALAPAATEVTLTSADLLFRAGELGTAADLEGIDVVDDPAGGPGWVVLSSQGNNRFLVLDRESLRPFALFSVAAAGAKLDGSENCDGLAATSRPFGPRFPEGALIVHDGRDSPGPATNFKWVGWDDVRRQLPALPASPATVARARW